jgi:hypothetical protein
MQILAFGDIRIAFKKQDSVALRKFLPSENSLGTESLSKFKRLLRSSINSEINLAMNLRDFDILLKFIKISADLLYQ